MSTKRKKPSRRPSQGKKQVPAHDCDDREHVMHFCSDPECPGDDCPNAEADLTLCGQGWSDLQASMQLENTADCLVCGGEETFRIRIGRHWLNEPRMIWRCKNGCSVGDLRRALLGRGIDPSCLGDYGLDAAVCHLDNEQPTALYRWFDAEGLLLYVGISDNLAGRVKGHERGSSWMELAVRSTIERFPGRIAALDAEEAAIKSEQPLFNYQHNTGPDSKQRLVDYLIKRGRTDLLMPSVSRG